MFSAGKFTCGRSGAAMASDEALDRDLLFRKIKTKADNKVIIIVAPLCEAFCVFFTWSFVCSVGVKISADLILRFASPVLVNCVVQRWTLFEIWKLGAASYRTLLTRGSSRYRLLL